jgi:hypothetical protein
VKAAPVAYPHIVKNGDAPAHLESHPRTQVGMIAADYLWRGWSADEIFHQYPYLTPAEVHAALGYYFDHREEIDAVLLAESRSADRWKQERPTASELVRLKTSAS